MPLHQTAVIHCINMDNFKGTKGDWNVVNYDAFYKEIADDKGDMIALVAKYDEYEESDSNTSLISKAPDLLETVSELLKELEFHGYTNSTAINYAKQLLREVTEI